MIRKCRKLYHRRRVCFLLFLLPSLAGVTLFVLLPFLDVVNRSFRTAVTGDFTGVKNYGVIFQNQAFVLAVKNTARFTVVCIPLLVLVGLLIAFPLSTMKEAGLIKSVYLFPLAMPTATIVLVWKMVFYRQGFLNLFLTRLGELTGLWGTVTIDYLGTEASFWVLVASYLWKNTGYTVVLWLAGILAIPNEFIEAAKVDGASLFQRILHIDIPALTSIMVLNLIMSAGGLMNVGFEKVWLLQTDLNKATSDVIAVYVYQQGIENAKYSYSTAVGLFNTVINIILLFVVNKIAGKISEDTSFI